MAQSDPEEWRDLSTQPSLLGYKTYNVDAISFTEIKLAWGWRDGAVVVLENTGAVNVALRTIPTDSSTEKILLSSDRENAMEGYRAVMTVPQTNTVCWAKAVSGTSTLILTEK